MRSFDPFPVEMLHRPGAMLRVRPKTRGAFVVEVTHRVYAEAHGTGLVMDVLRPVAGANGAAVIDVVSSGWQSDRVTFNEHLGFGLCDALCERGFTVFAISPGSSTIFTGEEMVKHVHAAIRHIRSHADGYGIETARVGLVGISAGGQLATLAALNPLLPRPESRDAWRRHGTGVLAVAAFCPPADLVDFGGHRLDRYHLEGLDVQGLLFRRGTAGHTDTEIIARLKDLSPAHVAVNFKERHPGGALPPLLLVHGTADSLVPVEQSHRLQTAWQTAGGTAELLLRAGADHLWLDNDEELNRVSEWFMRYML